VVGRAFIEQLSLIRAVSSTASLKVLTEPLPQPLLRSDQRHASIVFDHIYDGILACTEQTNDQWLWACVRLPF
jgi:hypothetical protein